MRVSMRVTMLSGGVLLGALTAGLIGHAPSRVHIDMGLTSSSSSQPPVYSGEQALILGPTGDPTPSATQVTYFLEHYLQSGTPEVAAFTGNPANVVAFTTPEQFTSLSYLQGDADVVDELLQRYSTLTAADPLYLFGYSQSSTILTAVDSHLNDQQWLDYVLTNGGHADDVTKYASELANLGSIAPDLRLVLVGDPAAAPILANVNNGFASSGFDNAGFTQFWLNSGLMGYGGGTIDGQSAANVGTGYIGGTGDNAPSLTDGYAMAGQNTNLDLSPTAVYTVDGDNWAQAQNFFGFPSMASWQHIVYPGLSAGDFSLSSHIGNVDYYSASDTSINLFQALWNAAMTWIG